jgi:hypothetical protein
MLEPHRDGRGDVVELKCRNCGEVFASGLTREQIQRPFPPGARRARRS